ncbi:hypothetical protein [Pseudomonas sp. CC6-YY-74]|uniref:hypothetical protein n=1 Tax=Pseudomonas sp. CC6-YY-74 TaxID=1930532 RepID=UPI0012ABF1E8|nr:hypothetical protein [Pseudomonas sp. CC6-YY-74]
MLGNAVWVGYWPARRRVQVEGLPEGGRRGGVEQAVGLGLEQVAKAAVLGQQVEAEGEYRE